MRFFVTALSLLGLSGVGHCFAVTLYKTHDCTGVSRHVNVWDNTCCDWFDVSDAQWMSAMPTAKSDDRNQMGFFFSQNVCVEQNHFFGIETGLWNPEFQIGKCIDIRQYSGMERIRAMSSRPGDVTVSAEDPPE